MSVRYAFCTNCGCTPPDTEEPRCDICGLRAVGIDRKGRRE